jgi:hypothetical protein
MNCRRETVEMAVPPGNRRGLDPRRTWKVRRRGRHPRTPGRMAISVVAVTPGRDETSGLTGARGITTTASWTSGMPADVSPGAPGLSKQQRLRL